ncbi:MAG: DUF4432 family protein [Sphaerochaetaceae bacterium]
MQKNRKFVLNLNKGVFLATKQSLFEGPGFSLESSLNTHGVEVLRLSIGEGEIMWLPYLGGELWDWKIKGVSQKFDGFVQEPSYGKNFLHNYGAFLIHCGVLSMGNPTAEDSHPQHGELPISSPQSAWVEVDLENQVFPIALCCTFEVHTPFEASYRFTAKILVNADGNNMVVDGVLKNNFNAPLDYQYLAHINFYYPLRGKLSYSVKPFSADAVEFLDEVIDGVVKDPSKMLPLAKNIIYDPELVAIMDHANKAPSNYGEGRYALATMDNNEGAMAWVVADTKVLDHTVVWLTQTPDRSACGFALPATGGPTGFANEKRKGTVKQLGGGQSVRLWYAFGVNCSTQYQESVTTAITQGK